MLTDAEIQELDDLLDDYEDEGGLEDGDCMTCGGDGFVECDDWDCWEPDCSGDCHTCHNCHGSGLAKDQVYW